MAEENKSPEVEIDTDGVNEETINVEAPEVSNEAFEKKQDVDLGYVDVSEGGKTAKELLQETKTCLLYTSPSPRDGLLSRMPSSA